MDKEIIDLGRKSGKMLLFGGVYSNLQALTSLIQFARQHDIPAKNCISTGDLIGYCGQPQETFDLFKSWGAHSILGNVEIQLRDDQDDCGCDFTAGSRCDGFSEIWFAFAKANLHSNSKEFFKSLPDHITFKYAGKNMGVVHGSFENVSQFIFKSTTWEEKQASLEALNADVIIAGHCGLPFTDKTDSKTWLNPGVIGMPANDGQSSTWAMIIDDADGFEYQHFRLTYDYETAMNAMIKQDLPQEYVRTLETGIWDNMEILPMTEKVLQGSELLLA
ncbi:metallophosphoesterase family protein [Nonlabens antarcticus]|uniref:metallophosphoesterase family protein n=1 Tax=Nonlabens antarcticus TaxID=392714 RepID=UPI0018915BB1|nr:metallophosphoesterase family protein [Nonlabens antarcticus]